VNELLQPGDFDQRPVRAKVALQNNQTAMGRQRLRGRMDHLAVGCGQAGHHLGKGLAGEGQCGAVDMPAADQLSDDDAGTAELVHVAGQIAATRTEIADQGRAREDAGRVVQIEGDACLVRDRRQMQGSIGRAAGRRDDAARVLERAARHDFTRKRRISQNRGHHPAPRLSQDRLSRAVDCGNHR
jgi:hypothetical protein